MAPAPVESLDAYLARLEEEDRSFSDDGDDAQDDPPPPDHRPSDPDWIDSHPGSSSASSGM